MALARLLILIMIVIPLQSMGGLTPGRVYASEYAAGKSAIIRTMNEGRSDTSEHPGTEGNVSRAGISGESQTSDQTDQINASADKTGAAAAEERSGGKVIPDGTGSGSFGETSGTGRSGGGISENEPSTGEEDRDPGSDRDSEEEEDDEEPSGKKEEITGDRDEEDGAVESGEKDTAKEISGAGASGEAAEDDDSDEKAGDSASGRETEERETGGKAGTGDSGSQAGAGDSGSQAGAGDSGSQAGTGDPGSQAGAGDSGRQARTGDSGSQARTGDSGSQAGTGDSGSQAGTGDSGSQAGSNGSDEKAGDRKADEKTGQDASDVKTRDDESGGKAESGTSEDKTGTDAEDEKNAGAASRESAGENESAFDDMAQNTPEVEEPVEGKEEEKADAGLPDQKKAQTESTSGEDSTGAENGVPAAEENAAAAETALSSEEEEMTAEEFERAYESVTEGAGGAGDGVSARIVSKQGELDYESLGIGHETSGCNNHTTPINVKDGDGNDYVGVCVVPNDRGWPKGSVLPNVSRVTDAVMIKLYYYTMLDSYGENLASSRGFGSAKKTAVAACHEAMSRRYAQLAGIEYERSNLTDSFRSLVSAYMSGASSKPLPDSDKVLVYISGRTMHDGHWIQAYVFGRVKEEEPSNIVLSKKCDDPEMLSAFTAYSISTTAGGEPVRFKAFSDKACTKPVPVYQDSALTKELSSIEVGANDKSSKI